MSSSKYNVTLTNYARGLSQDISATLANFLAPEVVVPAATGQYKNFDDKNTFQVIDTSRAVGGPAKRLEFAASDPTYNCLPRHSKSPSTTTNATRQAKAIPSVSKRPKRRPSSPLPSPPTKPKCSPP
jgi:hypothetical protein